MDNQQRKRIRAFAESVRQSLGLTVPVDVGAAVARLGGTVTSRNDEDAEAWVRALPDSGEHKFQIGVDSSVADVRYRFSIAHEIAHLFLHMGYLTERWRARDIYQDSVMYRFGFSNEEAEANEFAATFLMPEDEFLAQVDRLSAAGRVDLQALADHFNVSKDAARLRGCFLGRFAWGR